MKKFIVCVSVLLICVTAICAFVACNEREEDNAGLAAAKEYLSTLYRDAATETPADFTRASALRNENGTYTVTWTANVTSGTQTVTIVDNGDGTVTINIQEVDESVEVDTIYTLTATITDEAGNTDTLTYNYKIPKFKVATFAEYLAAENGTVLVMDGIVTGILPKGNGATNDGYYVNTLDGGGIYVYGTSGADLQVGQTVRITGEKDLYNGTHELKNATHKVVNSEITAVTPVDYTALYTNAADLKDKDLNEKQALLVTIKGVTVGTPGDNGYYYFTLAGKQSYVRISSSSCPMTTAQQNAFVETFNTHLGYTADVTGVICIYSGNFYLTPVSENAFSNFVAPAITDAEAVAGAKENLALNFAKVSEDGEFELPISGTGLYSNVEIGWALATTDCATLEGNVLNVVLPAEKTTITLTATLTKGTESDTKTFEIQVDAITLVEYAPLYITEPVDGSYIIAMDTSAVDGKTLYFVGTLNNKGALETTENINDAADVTIAAVSGKTGVYTIKVGDKYLEGFLSGNYNNMRLVDNAAEWTWNAEIGTFTCSFNNKDSEMSTFYFGTYLKNGAVNGNTMALSYISYVTGENLNKIGTEQFVGKFATLAVKEKVFEAITEPVDGTYKIAMDTSAVDGKTLYFVGTLNNKGALETTENINDAADVTIAAVSGKTGVYTIKVGDKYLEGFLSGNYNNMRLVDNAAEWTWNAEIGTFTCSFNNKDSEMSTFYFGTYLKNGAVNGNTMALSYISYVTGENLNKIGTEQFVGKFGTLVDGLVPVTPDAGEGEEPETPEEPAGPITTIEGALAGAVGATVNLTGTVESITEAWSSYGNNSFYITDGSKKILVYRSTTQVGIGDVVSVTGVLGEFNDINQVAKDGSVVTITTKHVCSDYTQADCLNAAVCTVCGTTQDGSVALGHTDDADSNGTCDRCGASMNSVNVTAAYVSDTTTNMVDGNNAATIGLDATIFTVTSTKTNGGSNHVGLNKAGNMRLYKGHSCELAISVASGYKIVSIKINLAPTNPSTDGLTVTDGTNAITAVSGIYTINGNSVVLFDADTANQVHIASIEIVYAPVA